MPDATSATTDDLGPLQATLGPPPGRRVVDVTVAVGCFAAAAFIAWRGGGASIAGVAVGAVLLSFAGLWTLVATRRPRRVLLHARGVVVERLRGPRERVAWDDVAEVIVRGTSDDVLVLRLKTGGMRAYTATSIAGFDQLVRAARSNVLPP